MNSASMPITNRSGIHAQKHLRLSAFAVVLDSQDSPWTDPWPKLMDQQQVFGFGLAGDGDRVGNFEKQKLRVASAIDMIANDR